MRMETERRVDVELIGGCFDGFRGNVPPESIKLGFLVVGNCPRHGEHAYCGCDDEMWHGYFSEPGKGAGQFIVTEEEE